jgi:tetratricopeptide (TPR) repeat protein
MADFNRAITLRPHADAYFNRANELSKNGNLNLAIEDYSQSIKLKASPDAYTNRAFAYLKTKDLGSCKADLNRALAMDGTYHPAYFLLAMEARQRNDFETACKNLRLAARYGNQKAERALPELCLNNSP